MANSVPKLIRKAEELGARASSLADPYGASSQEVRELADIVSQLCSALSEAFMAAKAVEK